MKKYNFQILLILISSFLGGGIFYYFYYEKKGITFVIGGAFLGALLAFLTIFLEERIRKIPLLKILGGSFGLILGLGLAKLISSFFEIFTSGVWQVFLYVMSGVGLGYLGIMLGGKKVEEVKISEVLEKIIEKISRKNFFPSLLLLSKKILYERVIPRCLIPVL